MRHQLKSFAAMFITALTLCVFIMPVVCTSSHADTLISFVSIKNDIAKSDIGLHKKFDQHRGQNQHNSGKIGDNHCVGHHCCTAKLVTSVEATIAFFDVSQALLNPVVNQVVSGFDIHGLDRPPKNLV